MTSLPKDSVIGDVIKTGSIITVKLDFDENSFEITEDSNRVS
jgi:hypothetical protein